MPGVLILVVVDNGLVLHRSTKQIEKHTVLILVVVDNGLVHEFDFIDSQNAFAS